jgi:transposase
MTRRKVPTTELPGWLLRQPASRVVMEACTQSPAVAAAAIAAGHSTKVVPGQLVRALGVGARGIKTDDRDAEALARASLHNEHLPSVHLRSERSRSRRELLSARATLLNARKSISLSIKSWLRGRLVVIRGRASSKSFATVVRRAALEHPDGLPLAIETLLTSFEHLCDQLEGLDQQVQAMAESDPICQRLMTIPGVGPQVSLAFTTHLDDPTRFASSDHLASYLALVPGEQTTGGKLKRTSTIHAGPLYLKALLVQGAWSLYRARPGEPVVRWAQAIADKRGKRIAIVALARKIATVMWAMWKHGSSYDPMRAARVPTNKSQLASQS